MSGIEKVDKVEEVEGIWVNGKFYPDEADDFERIERKSPKSPQKDKYKVKQNRRIKTDEDQY